MYKLKDRNISKMIKKNLCMIFGIDDVVAPRFHLVTSDSDESLVIHK